MCIDTSKKPHLKKHRRYAVWVGEYRGRMFFGKTPIDVMLKISRYGD